LGTQLNLTSRKVLKSFSRVNHLGLEVARRKEEILEASKR
jgi:hypothetical protein